MREFFNLSFTEWLPLKRTEFGSSLVIEKTEEHKTSENQIVYPAVTQPGIGIEALKA